MVHQRIHQRPKTKTTYYYFDGQIISLIREYNPDKTFKETHYNP
ncbi:DUF2963 domain-containing protein [Candidatus Phytoplasma sp. AldY-WA1]|nr:DUF2963 domain-containing protein [Candidatus Phytoplasma sp. AldY-WA1]